MTFPTEATLNLHKTIIEGEAADRAWEKYERRESTFEEYEKERGLAVGQFTADVC
jgi:hypothetical protein